MGFKSRVEKGSPTTGVQWDRYGGITGGIFSKFQAVGELTLIDFGKSVSYFLHRPSELPVR